VISHQTFLIYCIHQDKGKVHANSAISIKKKKNKELTDEEKYFNHKLSPKRVLAEHVNAKIKAFKMMSYPYRNRRRRHLLRADRRGIINTETQI
jgi:hypothetical protein